MDDAARGAKALSASDFPSAIKHYTRALIVNPHATDYYVKRSTAYSRLKAEDGGPNGEAALRDAEMAVALGIQRARRELIIAGQMRRAIVLYQLNRFGDADYLFKILRSKVASTEAAESESKAMAAMGLADKSTAAREGGNKSQELQIWEIKVKSQLSKLASEDEKGRVTVKEIPEIVVPKQEELKKLYQTQLREMEGEAEESSVLAENAVNTQQAPEKAEKEKTVDKAVDVSSSSGTENKPQPVPANSAAAATKFRHEWYQSHDAVVVTLYAKGVSKDQAEIDIQEHSLSVTFPTGAGSDFTFDLDPLYAAVDTTASRSSVMSTKIEILLRKKQPGQKWAALEGSADSTKQSTTTTISQHPLASAPAKAPSYPTSARGGAKDWDKVAAELSQKKKSKDKDEESKDEGADSDLEEYNAGDPVDAFFKRLYANADDDTRRAMMKSYYESKGTALSTNWGEVSKGKVHEHPPTDD
ncbi:Cochaperone protein [Emydomyces testavorans]|uniref:Cochaperone protein n=1 Tax=Emydomyces testavorans TaxID=2070801 RepID=A0AAF0IGW8_9EURO|nr:Cochaperone protein [Emydomyces testavorans]